MDYNSEGSKFVTAGKDTAIRVYDEATKSLLLTMKGIKSSSLIYSKCYKNYIEFWRSLGGSGYSIKSAPGHSNRIFSCKVLADEENLILSGGWDNTVQLWDIRIGYAVLILMINFIFALNLALTRDIFNILHA